MLSPRIFSLPLPRAISAESQPNCNPPHAPQTSRCSACTSYCLPVCLPACLKRHRANGTRQKNGMVNGTNGGGAHVHVKVASRYCGWFFCRLCTGVVQYSIKTGRGAVMRPLLFVRALRPAPRRPAPRRWRRRGPPQQHWHPRTDSHRAHPWRRRCPLCAAQLRPACRARHFASPARDGVLCARGGEGGRETNRCRKKKRKA